MADLEFASGFEVIDLRAAFTELCGSLKQLLWFWLVNFDKIIGSLTKFQGELCASDADLAVMTESVEDLCQVNEWLKRCGSTTKVVAMDRQRRHCFNENMLTKASFICL